MAKATGVINMDIEKIKTAINLGGGLITPNPDGTVVIMSPDLNYYGGITLNGKEFQVYRKATTLTLEEQLQRLAALAQLLSDL